MVKVEDKQVLSTQGFSQKKGKASGSIMAAGGCFSAAKPYGKDAAEHTSGIQDYLKELQLQFPGAKIHVEEISVHNIRDYAQSHQGIMQIVISPQALKKMMSDPEFKKNCERLIADTRKSLYLKAGQYQTAGKQVVGSGLILDQDGDISQWTAASEKKQDYLSDIWFPSVTAKQKQGSVTRLKMKDGTFIVFKKKLSYQPSRDLARIAKASTQQGVKTTMGGIRASIYQLKSSGGDKKIANQLAAQAEQVLLKAQSKIKNLKKEELIQSAEKKASAEADQKRAAYLRRVLRERIVKRVVREHAQIRDYYPTPQEIKREEDKGKDWAGDDSGISGYDGYGQQSYLPAGGTVQTESLGGSCGNTGVYIDITF